MATTIEDLKNQIMERAKAQIATAEHDYQKCIEDCKMGVYDKWFRYHRKDDGNAYDKGWVFQTKQHNVKRFLSCRAYNSSLTNNLSQQ